MQECVNTSDLLERVNGGLPHSDEGLEELQQKIRMGYRLEDVCFLEKLKNELGPNYENEFGFLFILVDPSDPHYKEEKIVVYGPESKKYVEQERFTHLHCGRPDSAPPKKIKGRRIKKIRW